MLVGNSSFDGLFYVTVVADDDYKIYIVASTEWKTKHQERTECYYFLDILIICTLTYNIAIHT